MSPAFEAFLAALYADGNARERFLRDPRGASTAAGLSPKECKALENIDRIGLQFAARSFDHKRAQKLRRRSRRSVFSWLRSSLLRLRP